MSSFLRNSQTTLSFSVRSGTSLHAKIIFYVCKSMTLIALAAHNFDMKRIGFAERDRLPKYEIEWSITRTKLKISKSKMKTPFQKFTTFRFHSSVKNGRFDAFQHILWIRPKRISSFCTKCCVFFLLFRISAKTKPIIHGRNTIDRHRSTHRVAWSKPENLFTQNFLQKPQKYTTRNM